MCGSTKKKSLRKKKKDKRHTIINKEGADIQLVSRL